MPVTSANRNSDKGAKIKIALIVVPTDGVIFFGGFNSEVCGDVFIFKLTCISLTN